MMQVKKLALLATVALGAMSCSNNEIIETLSEQNEIRFSGVQMGNNIITRANQGLTGKETFGVMHSWAKKLISQMRNYLKQEALGDWVLNITTQLVISQ